MGMFECCILQQCISNYLWAINIDRGLLKLVDHKTARMWVLEAGYRILSHCRHSVTFSRGHSYVPWLLCCIHNSYIFQPVSAQCAFTYVTGRHVWLCFKTGPTSLYPSSLSTRSSHMQAQPDSDSKPSPLTVPKALHHRSTESPPTRARKLPTRTSINNRTLGRKVITLCKWAVSVQLVSSHLVQKFTAIMRLSMYTCAHANQKHVDWHCTCMPYR